MGSCLESITVQPGGGIQYEFSKTISDLLKDKILQRVGK